MSTESFSQCEFTSAHLRTVFVVDYDPRWPTLELIWNAIVPKAYISRGMEEELAYQEYVQQFRSKMTMPKWKKALRNAKELYEKQHYALRIQEIEEGPQEKNTSRKKW